MHHIIDTGKPDRKYNPAQERSALRRKGAPRGTTGYVGRKFPGMPDKHNSSVTKIGCYDTLTTYIRMRQTGNAGGNHCATPCCVNVYEQAVAAKKNEEQSFK